jgi:hypothetical protein
MTDSLARVVVLLVALSGSAALAQESARAASAGPDDPPTTPSAVTWLTGYRFHLSATSLRADDPRFVWDCAFGGDVDMVDYRYGRLNFLADYDVGLGREFRAFDPNQGRYRLDLSASARTGAAEFQGIFHHVSRHLGDRANGTSISWNTFGLKATGTHASGPTAFTYTGRVAKVLQAAFVDYAWEAGASGEVQYRLSPRVAVVGRADLDVMGVDRAVAGRDTQVGGKVEGALRLYGTGAGIEAFGGWEQRIDPYPTVRETRSWAIVGFRFISR